MRNAFTFYVMQKAHTYAASKALSSTDDSLAGSGLL